MARKPRAADAAKNTAASSTASASPAAFQNSPEFQAALAAGIAQALPLLREQILSNLGQARGADAPAAAGDVAFADALATSIARLGDQGVGRKHVSPEVLRQRAEARALMTQLIVEARARGEIPRYQLKHKVYLDEVLVDPVWIGSDHVQRPTEIEWPSVPSEAMRPANEVAEGIFKAFSDSIGTVPADHQQPTRANRVTAGGLVIHGRPIPPSPAHADPASGLSGEGGLRIPHLQRAGQYKEVSVLGTIAAPARQQAG